MANYEYYNLIVKEHMRGSLISPISSDVNLSSFSIAERIVSALEENDLSDSVDLVVTSDHGMAKAPGVVDVWHELGNDAEVRAALEVVEDDAYLAVNVRESAPDAVRERALAALAKLPGGKFYRREQMPERLRFRAHRRIPEVIVLGDESTYYWVSILRISSIKVNYNQTHAI